MDGSLGDTSEEPVMYEKRKKGWRMSCDIGKATEWLENNINHDLREIDYTGDDWKTLGEDREVWRAYDHAVMNLRVR